MVGPGGLPTSRNINNLDCPTAPKARSGRKGQFPRLSNLAVGPPKIETAAPTAIGSGGRVNQSNSNNSYREPPLASNWAPFDDVAALLVKRLQAHMQFRRLGEEKARHWSRAKTHEERHE